MTAFRSSLTRPSARLASAAVVAALGLTGCTGTAPAPAPSSGTAGSAAASPAAVGAASAASGPTSSPAASPGGARQATALAVQDAWVKATAGSTTALFGTVENRSDAPVHVVGVTSTAAPRAELHETVTDANGQSTMRQAADGFTIPAHGRLDLVPGGSHVMLMDLTAPVEAGQDLAVSLTLEDGSTLDVPATARPFTGAKESYHGTAGSASATSSSAHAGH